MTNELNRLLAEGQGYLPIYRNGLANHAPMALSALQSLGADGETLQRFFEGYRTRLNTFEPKSPQSMSDWTACRGRRDAFADLLAHFRAEIARQGVGTTMRQALPELLPGVGASAFHGVIRLGYAVQASNEAEVAHGLAYWASEYLWLGPVQEASEEPALALLKRYGDAFRDFRYRRQPSGLIIDRMDEIVRSPLFAELGQQPQSLDWSALLALAGFAYAGTGDFILLHGLTGAHALYNLKPWIEDEDRALRYYWLAFLAAFATSKESAPTRSLENDATVTPESARLWAIQQSDDHDIKLIWTALDLMSSFPSESSLWRAVMAKRMSQRESGVS